MKEEEYRIKGLDMKTKGRWGDEDLLASELSHSMVGGATNG